MTDKIVKGFEKNFFTDELIENTYLYCYKLLNNSSDAEDLAQDILLEALSAVRSGKEIVSFYSWYWKLAHNRFCLFLRIKKNKAVSLDAYGGEIAANYDFAKRLISKEDTARLNYAISRLSAIHRQIIILYYLQECSIPEIAKRLSIPEGTVKRRLFDAKTEIRKGVSSMNNGKSSYAPAELKLWGGYGAPKYWNYIYDLMTRQIFVACREKPRTIREIADEIGVAPVYFEEKLNYLLENKFIKEVSKGKYLTDFCILPESVHAEFKYELSQIYKDIGKEMTDAIYSVEKEIRSLDFYGNQFAFPYLLWVLYTYGCNVLSNQMLKMYEEKWKGKIPENNGKDYRYAGTVSFPEEKINYREIKAVQWSNLHNSFQTAEYSHIMYANLFEHAPFPDRDSVIYGGNINLVMKLYTNPSVSLTPVEEEQAAFLISKGYLMKKDNRYYLTLPVMSYECKEKIHEILGKAVQPLAEKYIDSVSDLGDRMLLPIIRKDLIEEYVHWIMQGNFWALPFVLYYGMYEGKTLEIPKDYSQSAAATAIYFSK